MVSLAVGDTLRFTCQFYHQGAAYSGAKLRAAIGHRGSFGFDEILYAEAGPFSFPQDINPKLYQQVVNIPITSSIGAGTDYEAYVKLMSIPGSDQFWYGPSDDIAILGGPATFSGLTVTYAKI